VDGDADAVVDVVLEVQGQGHHGKTSGLKKIKNIKKQLLLYYTHLIFLSHTATHTSTHTPTHRDTHFNTHHDTYY
jgi:hypothetical protein